MAELFDITDGLEILSKLGEPDLLDRSAAALKSLQESSYSEFVVEHRRIQLLSQSADEEDRDDALECLVNTSNSLGLRLVCLRGASTISNCRCMAFVLG